MTRMVSPTRPALAWESSVPKILTGTVAGGWPPQPASVESRGKSPESLDFSILREFLCEDYAPPGIDPRKSPETIAKRLRVSPATVRRRLTLWRTRGFLRGYDVVPNPGLFGGRLVARLIDFRDAVVQERAIGSLSLIDGMIQIVPARTELLVVYFVDSESQAERRLRQLGEVDGVLQIGPELPFEFPPCLHQMSRLDWRLVLSLRRNPEASLGELAQELGQSTRTTSRRFDALLDEGALMFDPILDFSRFTATLVVLIVTTGSPEILEETVRQVRALHPQTMRSWGPPLVDQHGGKVPTVHFWVSAPTFAELDELRARVAHLPGVREVVLWDGRLMIRLRTWLNERIEAMVRLGEAAAGGVRRA